MPHPQHVVTQAHFDSTPAMTHPRPASSAEPVPQLLRAWLKPFRSVFTVPVWEHALVLVLGAVLAPGKRTVTAALRVVGRHGILHP